MLFSVALIFVVSASAGAQIYAIKRIVDCVAAHTPLSEALFWLSIEAFTILVPFINNELANGIIQARIQHKMEIEVGTRIYRALGCAPISRFDDPAFANQQGLTAMYGVQGSARLVRMILDLATHLLSLSALFAVAATLSRYQLLIGLLGCIPLFVTGIVFSKKKHFDEQYNSERGRRAMYFSWLLADRHAARELRIWNCHEFFREKWVHAVRLVFETISKRETTRAGATTAAKIISLASYIVAASLAFRDAYTGVISVGDFMLLAAGIARIQAGTDLILLTLTWIGEDISRVATVKKWIDEQELHSLRRPVRPIACGIEEIEFQDVCFSYGDNAPCLSNVSFTIRRGETVALVGRNGAGKSTVAKLMLGFYMPSSGRVLINGVDLKSIDLSHYWTYISAVFQDFCRFDITIRENVTFGKDETSKNNDIAKALSDAGAEGLLTLSERGVDTIIGNRFTGGRELSGGQWQKIALARALFHRRSAIVLDEPTSSLDVESEFDFNRRVLANVPDKLCVVISHRLTTVKMADRVIFLEAGRIVADGTFADVRRENESFATLADCAGVA